MGNNAIEIDKDLEDIFDEYLKHREEDIIKFEISISQNDFLSIQVIGHRLAGNAGSYGLVELGKIGSSIEAAAKDKDTRNLKKYFEEYVQFIKNLDVRFI